MNNEAADKEWVENVLTKIRNPIAVECQVAIFLYYVGEEGRYRETSKCFWRIQKFSLDFNSKSYKIIVEHLGPKLIKLPKAVPEVGALVENFLNEHGFPLRLGAIDVTHRRIKQPREYYTDYINRKGFRSINVITDIAF